MRVGTALPRDLLPIQRVWQTYISVINVNYSTAALLAMQSAVIATAIPSVCLSVARWYPIQTNEGRIMQSSLCGSKNTLVF